MLSRFIKLIIGSNLFIAIAAVLFMWANRIWLQIPLFHSLYLDIEVFFSTFFIYQFSRYVYFRKGIYADTDELVEQSFKRFPTLNLTSIILSGLVSVVCLFFLQKNTVIALACTGILSILYPFPVGKIIGSNIRLRDTPFLKLFLIAIVWSTTSVLLPAFEAGLSPFVRRDIFLLWAVQFIYLLFITLPFDIHDFQVDKNASLKTLPVVFGVRVSKWICFALGLIYGIGILYVFMIENFRTISAIYLSEAILILIWILIVVLQYFTMCYSDKIQKWWIKLVYDGSMIIYFLILIFTCKLA